MKDLMQKRGIHVKKFLSIAIALLMVTMVFIGCDKKTNEQTSSGSSSTEASDVQQSKQVKVTVTININGETKSFAYETDKATLEELLVEKKDELKATFQDSEYGKMILGMNGYVADASKNEYFEILVDGVSSQVGAKEIPLEEGKTYEFKLSKF